MGTGRPRRPRSCSASRPQPLQGRRRHRITVALLQFGQPSQCGTSVRKRSVVVCHAVVVATCMQQFIGQPVQHPYGVPITDPQIPPRTSLAELATGGFLANRRQL